MHSSTFKMCMFRMNDLPIELCERKSYQRTTKILGKKFGKRGPLQRLDNFIKFKKQANEKTKENARSKSKLSFNVSNQFSFLKFYSRTLDQFRWGRR